jgi:tRNA(His) guanylyltransferase
MIKSDIGNRMKFNYEEAYKIRLPMRMPVILRLDGKTFHTFTKQIGAEKPFDGLFIAAMNTLAQHLCKEIPTAQIAYIQSDEISILLHNYKKLNSQPWFGNEIQKMVSVSAGMASSFMSRAYEKEAIFDSRVFVLPESEVVNYFIWRQQDATRNSISMLAQSFYSHEELYKKNVPQMQDMMIQKEVNWDNLPTYKKRGTCIIKNKGVWGVDSNIPTFSKDRDYIRKLLEVEEE